MVVQGEDANERIVAVGRYHAPEHRPDVAEVSFLVEDAMQRRGIGTLLLDTLAEIARAHGINRFSADVLADNHVMLSVFRKAGYGLSSRVSYGVTHLEFPIAYSEIAESRAEMQEAEAERASLRPVLAPQSIAVIGASRDPQSVGGALFRNLIRWGFAGAVYPVNPRARAVAGGRAYASITDLPEVPELAFISVPASSALDAARQCADRGVRALCVISAGFAETGSEGAAAQAELLNLCRAHGMRLVGPNCLGLVNTSNDVRMLGAFAPAAAYQQLAERLSSHGIVLAAANVMPIAPRGVEVIAGITHDPVFGPLVAFGSGGVLVELLDDVVFRVLPLTDADATTMIRDTRAHRLLQGFRGSAKADVAAVERLLLALGALAEAAPRIAEVDLNPVIVHEEGAGVSLIDARVRLSE